MSRLFRVVVVVDNLLLLAAAAADRCVTTGS